MNPRRQVEIALRQWLRTHHGVIGYTEALLLGATPAMIQSKTARGEWARMHKGVYRDTAALLGHYQDLRAACVATAGFGVASHASAAWVWGLLTQPPARPELTVRLGTHDCHRHARITIHRSSDLVLDEAVNRNNIPVTNPLRTLVDLAGTALPRELTEAVDNALARQLVTTAGLEAEIRRRARPGRNGVGILRCHLRERGFVGAPPPSVLEAHLRRIVNSAVRSAGATAPSIELRVGDDGQYRFDVAWSEIRFAVEADGYAWHFSPAHMQRDNTRRNELQRSGWTILVFSWRQILNERTRVVNEIVSTLRELSASRPEMN
ncbi:MAG: DUF559 domain-containing protein [Actinomycetota bacterium]|nr:DUF559 domain-containing protein [Actinomycetota bacterium]